MTSSSGGGFGADCRRMSAKPTAGFRGMPAICVPGARTAPNGEPRRPTLGPAQAPRRRARGSAARRHGKDLRENKRAGSARARVAGALCRPPAAALVPPIAKRTQDHAEGTQACAHERARVRETRVTLRRVRATPSPLAEHLARRDCWLPSQRHRQPSLLLLLPYASCTTETRLRTPPKKRPKKESFKNPKTRCSVFF